MVEGASQIPPQHDAAATDRFDALYAHHAPLIHAYCARRTSADRVDDAVAETFLVAWRRLDDVPDGREALLWLYGVARRVVGHQWRSALRRERLRSRLHRVTAATTDGPEERALLDEECRTVLDAVALLRPADAELVLLAAWEQLSIADLALLYEIEPNTASQRLSRARKRLAREYDRLAEHPTRSPVAQEGGAR